MTYLNYKKKIEFKREDFDEIDRYCKKKIKWFASAWDLESQNFLRKYKNRFNKVASAMLTNEKLLHQIAREKNNIYFNRYEHN